MPPGPWSQGYSGGGNPVSMLPRAPPETARPLGSGSSCLWIWVRKPEILQVVLNSATPLQKSFSPCRSYPTFYLKLPPWIPTRASSDMNKVTNTQMMDARDSMLESQEAPWWPSYQLANRKPKCPCTGHTQEVLDGTMLPLPSHTLNPWL